MLYRYLRVVQGRAFFFLICECVCVGGRSLAVLFYFTENGFVPSSRMTTTTTTMIRIVTGFSLPVTFALKSHDVTETIPFSRPNVEKRRRSSSPNVSSKTIYIYILRIYISIRKSGRVDMCCLYHRLVCTVRD